MAVKSPVSFGRTPFLLRLLLRLLVFPLMSIGHKAGHHCHFRVLRSANSDTGRKIWWSRYEVFPRSNSSRMISDRNLEDVCVWYQAQVTRAFHESTQCSLVVRPKARETVAMGSRAYC